MSEEIIYLGQKNPYASNPDAVKIKSAEVDRDGRTYTKIDYLCKLSFLNRIIKLIGAFVLTIFTGFIALAWENPRNLWVEGFKGEKTVSVLTPLSHYLNFEDFVSKGLLLQYLNMSLEELETEVKKYLPIRREDVDGHFITSLIYIILAEKCDGNIQKRDYLQQSLSRNSLIRALQANPQKVFAYFKDLENYIAPMQSTDLMIEFSVLLGGLKVRCSQLCDKLRIPFPSELRTPPALNQMDVLKGRMSLID